METKQTEQMGVRVCVTSMLVNLGLSIFKGVAGILGRSSALLSDAVHSASDVFSGLIVLIGIKLSARETDERHPYGYERMECVAAIILAVILTITGGSIGLTAIQTILQGSYTSLAAPGMLALVAAAVSIAIKEGMFWYTRTAAKRIDSGTLMAEAWHHRADSLSTLGSLLGIIGARRGFAILDPFASIIISLLVIKAAIDIFKDAVSKLTDKAVDDDTKDEMRLLIEEQEGIANVGPLRTRLFGNRVYVNVDVAADGDITLEDAHVISTDVGDALEEAFPEVKATFVRVMPETELDIDLPDIVDAR